MDAPHNARISAAARDCPVLPELPRRPCVRAYNKIVSCAAGCMLRTVGVSWSVGWARRALGSESRGRTRGEPWGY